MYRRAKRLIPFLLLALLLPLLGPDSALTQMPGRGKGRRPGNGAIFDRYAGGADSFDVNTVAIPPRMLRAGETEDDKRAQWNAFLQKKGVTNGLMTRELLQTFFVEQMNRPQGPGGKLAQPKQRGVGNRADTVFNQYSDGKDSFDVTSVPIPPRFLSAGETEESKRERWQAFLKKHGVTNDQMTRDLFRTFFSELSTGQATQVPTPIGGVGPQTKPAEDERPKVYRMGKMPKDLPAWFEQCDKDRDGQVGLYEWKANGLPVAAFLAMDQNGDGFLTVEEVLRHQKAQKKKGIPTDTSRKAGK